MPSTRPPRKPPPAPAIAYGTHPDQVANLHLPAGAGPFPVVVLVHGGFWRARWDRTTLDPVARDLARRGFAAWNVEYRRVGQPGGGWPGTLADVAAATDHLIRLAEVDAGRVGVVGHSAGGQLALWLAARGKLPGAAVGAGPAITPRCAVSLAGVADLEAAESRGLGDGAVRGLLGGSPADVPERYAAASPRALLPFGVPQLLVHGADDDAVPVELSRAYAMAAAAAGDDVELVELPRTDHFDVIDPDNHGWAAVTATLERSLGS